MYPRLQRTVPVFLKLNLVFHNAIPSLWYLLLFIYLLDIPAWGFKIRTLHLLQVTDEGTSRPCILTSNTLLTGNRRWRSSELAPYGGHIMLALTGCHHEFFVRSYLQEIPFPILNCPVDCPWSVFRDTLEHVLEYCPDVPYCPSRAGAEWSCPHWGHGIAAFFALWYSLYCALFLW